VLECVKNMNMSHEHHEHEKETTLVRSKW